MKLLLAIY